MKKLSLLLLLEVSLLGQEKRYEYLVLRDIRSPLNMAAGIQPHFIDTKVAPCKKKKDIDKGKTCRVFVIHYLNDMVKLGWEVVAQSGETPTLCSNIFSNQCPEYRRSMSFTFKREVR
jgi:hypothetical protein